MMRIIKIIGVCVLLGPVNVYGQSENASIKEMHRLAKLNSRSDNYVQTPLSSPPPNESTPYFEAGIKTCLNLINYARDQEKFKYKYADLNISMFIVIRMYDAFSSPIYPPNYQPGINYFKYFKPRKNIYSYLDVELKHLSNGQSGSFYIPETDTLNLINGDFSTNFLSVKYTQIHQIKQFRLFQTYGLRTDWGIPNSVLSLDNQLKESYGIYRVMADFQVISPTFSFFKSATKFRLLGRTENTYILGDLSNYPSEQKYRYSLKAKLTLYPENTIKLGGFLQYYTGRDYYNIRFGNHLNIWSVGMTYNL